MILQTARRQFHRRRLFLSCAFAFLLYILSHFWGSGNTPSAPSRSPSAREPPKTIFLPLTVTKTRTAWVRTTHTVVAAAEEQTAPVVVRDRNQPLIQPWNHDHQTALFASLEKHTYRPDGLLELNPKGPHPIFELIRRAEDEWDAKLAKASVTLEQAVSQYKIRYKRDPPLGFDKWWDYVEKNNVMLPDEYDQIYRDLEPYWGMDPNDLQAIEAEWEGHGDSYTIGKAAGELIGLVNYTLPEDENLRMALSEGAFVIMDLLEDVEEHIPPFRAIFSPHDNPNLHTDWELKEAALAAAAAGTFIDINNPPEVKLHGWKSACHPKSPAWLDNSKWNEKAADQTSKTFIYNHLTTMDPCVHPRLLQLHGQFISHETGPVPHRRMIPQFSYSPTMLHHDIMAAVPHNWIEDIVPRSDDPDWDQKYDERLQWRGRNTGMWVSDQKPWKHSQRSRLVDWANAQLDSNITVLPPPNDEHMQVGEGVSVKKAKYAPALTDVAFVDTPVSCEGEMCRKLEKHYEFRKQHDIKTAGAYKYVIDVDGNGWSSRFKRLITTNSLIFKSTIYPEWYTERVQPWVHYVPIQVDLSDLYDALLFFRGEPSGANAHDDLARKIALAGRNWSKTYWRKEDLTAYMFRLFLEYARVMSPDRKTMSYIPGASPAQPLAGIAKPPAKKVYKNP